MDTVDFNLVRFPYLVLSCLDLWHPVCHSWNTECGRDDNLNVCGITTNAATPSHRHYPDPQGAWKSDRDAAGFGSDVIGVGHAVTPGRDASTVAPADKK